MRRRTLTNPLSVCARSTVNGSLATTSSMKAIAVFWSQQGQARSTRSRVQSSMAVNW